MPKNIDGIVIRTRELGLEDLDGMHEASRRMDHPWTKVEFEETLHQEFQKSYGVFAQKDGGEILASFAVWQIIPPEAELHIIATSPEFRSRGFAKFLMENNLRLLEDGSCEKFFLEVRKSNEVAIALYEKLGFQITGTRKEYYNRPVEDALIMERKCSIRDT